MTPQTLDNMRWVAHRDPEAVTPDWLVERLNALEAELDGKWLRLPLDADGVPIRVGDELYNGEVIAFGGLAEGGVVFVHRGFEDGNYILEAFASNVTHHVRQRTVEDVLREMVGMTDHPLCEGDIQAFADEIRELMGAGE